MGDGLWLASRHWKTARRSRGTRVLLALGLVALGLVVWSTSGSTSALAGFLVVGALGLGAAAWAGGLLPGDRREGREAWLATLVPWGWVRRTAAAAAGVGLALVVAVAGSLLLGVILRARDPALVTRATEPQPELLGARLRSGPETFSLAGSVEGTRTLELVFGVRYGSIDDAGRKLNLRHQAGDGVAQTTLLAYRAPFRLSLAEGVDRVELTNETPGCELVVREARVLGKPRPAFWTFLLAGLILAATSVAVAPMAVAVSRRTSGPTASAVVLVLVLAGVVHAGLGDLSTAAAADGGDLQALGTRIVGATAAVAPDLSASLSLLAEPAGGRALHPGAVWRALLPLLLYGAIGFVLVCVPLPGHRPWEVAA